MPEPTDKAKRVEIAIQLRGEGRREKLMGHEFRVHRATLVRSQILNNNLGSTFLPAAAITQQWADAANMAPVLIDHPTRRNHPISARDAEILNAHGVGFTMRAKAENGTLTADVFLDDARAADVPDLKAILEKLNAGESVELSTGFPVSIVAQPGAHNGKSYDVEIWPTGFDHLAVFATKTGACSVRDGCGLGVNHQGPCDTGEPMDEKQVGRLEQAINRLGEKMATFFGGQKPEGTPKPAANEGDPPPKGDDDMNREQMIAQLAAAGPLDTSALNKLSDCQLKALAGANNAAPDPAPTGDGWDKANEWQRKFLELDAETKLARNELARERSDMLDSLLMEVDRAGFPYAANELKEMDIVQLRKVYKLAKPQRPFYGGLGGPRTGDETHFDGSWIKPRIAAQGSALDAGKEKH